MNDYENYEDLNHEINNNECEMHEEHDCDYYEQDYDYDQSMYDACDGMEDAYWNID